MQLSKTLVRVKQEGILGIRESTWVFPEQFREWEMPFIKAFMNDDDWQEMTISSANLGFSYTYSKIRN